MPLLTTMNITFASYCAAVASSCPFIRKSPSPQNEMTGRLGMDQLRRRRRRARRSPSSRSSAPSCGAEAGVLVVAVHPAGEVAGAVGDDGLGRQALAQPRHHLARIERRPAPGSGSSHASYSARAARVPSFHAARLDRRRAPRAIAANSGMPELIRQVRLVDAARAPPRRDARARTSASGAARRSACSRRSSSRPGAARPRSAGRSSCTRSASAGLMPMPTSPT